MHDAPLAVAVDGTVLLNVTEVDGTDDADAALRQAEARGDVVFVGIVAKADEAAAVLARLADAGAEAVARVRGRQRRRRTTARRRASTAP
jgi:hypothetical protein